MDVISSMLCDWCCKYYAYVLDFSSGTNVDVGPRATLNPCDGRSKSTKMDVGINAITNVKAYVGELGPIDLRYHQLKFISVSKHYAWHDHLLISIMPIFFHCAKQFFLNLLHLIFLLDYYCIIDFVINIKVNLTHRWSKFTKVWIFSCPKILEP